MKFSANVQSEGEEVRSGWNGALAGVPCRPKIALTLAAGLVTITCAAWRVVVLLAVSPNNVLQEVEVGPPL